jgi:hypothetical protein
MTDLHEETSRHESEWTVKQIDAATISWNCERTRSTRPGDVKVDRPKLLMKRGSNEYAF